MKASRRKQCPAPMKSDYEVASSDPRRTQAEISITRYQNAPSISCGPVSLHDCCCKLCFFRWDQSIVELLVTTVFKGDNAPVLDPGGIHAGQVF